MYIKGRRDIRATTIDINRRKKDVINPLNSLLNYL